MPDGKNGYTMEKLMETLVARRLPIEDHVADCNRVIEALKLKEKMAPLIRLETADEFLRLFSKGDSMSNIMLKLIATMMTVYDETRSIEMSDNAGAEIQDNSNHGIAKTHVAYFYKNGADYLADWSSQNNRVTNDKQLKYEEFIQRCQEELRRQAEAETTTQEAGAFKMK